MFNKTARIFMDNIVSLDNHIIYSLIGVKAK